MIYVSASVFAVLYAILLCIVAKLYYNYYHECQEMAKNADSDKEWPLVHKLMGRNVQDMQGISRKPPNFSQTDYTVSEQYQRRSGLMASQRQMPAIDQSGLLDDQQDSFDTSGDGKRESFFKNKLLEEKQGDLNY